jgi:acetyl esterase/lipase
MKHRSAAKKSCFAIALFFLLSVIAAPAQHSSQNNLTAVQKTDAIFDYDRTASLDVREKSNAMRGAVKIVDLTFASAKGGFVSAYLVTPENAAKGKHPGIVFQHWMMANRTNANRTEFLDEAVELAHKIGAISLLIDAPMKRQGFSPPADAPKGSADVVIVSQAVADLRRAIDVLLARPEVDNSRLAYVGHSFGAAMGGILLGVEPRFKSFALLAGEFAVQERNRNNQSENFVKWRAKFSNEEFEDYLRRTAPIDPSIQVIKPRTAPVLLQYAKNDEYFAGEQDIIRAAKIVAEPKTVKIYNDGAHELNAEARRDRVEWLANQIGAKTNSQKQEKPKQQKTFSDYVMPPVVYSVPRMEEVKIKKDLTYRTNENTELKLDVYQPLDTKSGERRPIVFFVHGTADLSSKPKDWGIFQSWGKLVAATGMTGVVFNHRIVKNKTQTDPTTAETDLLAAIAYVRKNAAEFNADENRIAIVAFSGGGPLLSSALRENMPNIKALGSFYSFLDIREAKMFSAANDADTLNKFSPVNFIKPEMPPIFIARAGRDMPDLNAAVGRFVQIALEKNANIEIMNHPAGEHGFDNQTENAERSREIIKRFLDFLQINLNHGGKVK